jgi:hypothetical protein
MQNDNHYQVLFCDRTIKIVYSVADARRLAKSNEYAAKVVSITKFYLDKSSKQKSNSIKF